MRTVLDFFLIALFLTLALMATGTYIVWRGVRRLRRTLRTRFGATRRSWVQPVVARPISGRPGNLPAPFGTGIERLTSALERPMLTTRAWLPGPTRAVAAARRDLDREVAGAVLAVQAARQSGDAVPELERGVAKLAEHARQLQLDLRIIAAEPDHAVRTQLLAVHSERAYVIRRACADVRAAVLNDRSSSAEPALRSIVREIDDAVTSVRLRARAYRDLSGS
jgi:hypothetical protein